MASPTRQDSAAELPLPGSIFTFRLSDGRYGALRVVRILEPDSKTEAYWGRMKGGGPWRGRRAVVVTTPYLGKKPPALNDARLRDVLRLTHHSWNGKGICYQVNSPPDKGIVLIGVIESPATDETLKAGLGYWTACADSYQLLAQEKWDNGDPQEILRADQRAKEQALAESRRAADRKSEHFRGLTLSQLKRKRFFPRWETHVRPKVAVTKARAIIKDTINWLIELGDRPRKSSILKTLRKMIEDFNRLQKEYEFIETAERDDICEHLGELLLVLELKEDPALLFEKWENM